MEKLNICVLGSKISAAIEFALAIGEEGTEAKNLQISLSRLAAREWGSGRCLADSFEFADCWADASALAEDWPELAAEVHETLVSWVEDLGEPEEGAECPCCS